MNVRSIIFDWDGTLAKTLDLWLEGFQRSFEKRDLTFQPNEIVSEFFYNYDKVQERYPRMDFPAVAEETRGHVHQEVHTASLYEGVQDTLNALKNKDITLSLVTSSARKLLNKGMGAHRLEEFFASTVAGDDGYGHKPDPQPFATTLERVGANASETLVIGDSHVDILAGQAIGCQTCWFAPSHNRLFHDFDHIRSIGADHEISRIRELVDLT
ncbi:pyrophosphatase PpaX [Pseudovibrio japonicus]|uniref:phosphoglycolate phosphatase n=2 Tax=Pseudovibrio japonicus TaxID=366534 RepID=A0ABQ3ESK7_9HYPH|nr:pyrophosphatase PpaX [Pseudovibrio japonicus]